MGGKPNKGTRRDRRLKANKANKPQRPTIRKRGRAQ